MTGRRGAARRNGGRLAFLDVKRSRNFLINFMHGTSAFARRSVGRYPKGAKRSGRSVGPVGGQAAGETDSVDVVDDDDSIDSLLPSFLPSFLPSLPRLSIVFEN